MKCVNLRAKPAIDLRVRFGQTRGDVVGPDPQTDSPKTNARPSWWCGRIGRPFKNGPALPRTNVAVLTSRSRGRPKTCC